MCLETNLMPRNEPSNFERLHGHMRNLKQELGIDMLHPHGVSIHDKMYPANNKTISFSEKNNPDTGFIGFNVPLENGHRLHIFGHGLHHPEGVLKAQFEVQYPHKWIDLDATASWTEGRSEAYSYYPKDVHPLTNRAKGIKNEDILEIDNLTSRHPEMLQDFMERVSSAPTKGYKRSWKLSTNSDLMRDNPDEMMNEDDFAEFHKYKHLGGGAGSKNASPSHVITATIHSTKGTPESIQDHIYDIKTEQLRKIED